MTSSRFDCLLRLMMCKRERTPSTRLTYLLYKVDVFGLGRTEKGRQGAVARMRSCAFVVVSVSHAVLLLVLPTVGRKTRSPIGLDPSLRIAQVTTSIIAATLTSGGKPTEGRLDGPRQSDGRFFIFLRFFPFLFVSFSLPCLANVHNMGCQDMQTIGSRLTTGI
ncbi:hypothetical protein GGS20DRAFT_538668, partial [Poronia punctata]